MGYLAIIKFVYFTVDHQYIIVKESLWSRSYCSWIYNYLCNQCLSPLQLWVWTPYMPRCTRYNIMWWSLSVTYDRSVVFSNKTDRHFITEILLKVALNTISKTKPNQNCYNLSNTEYGFQFYRYIKCMK